jgi:hypothetical protein
MLAIQNVDTLFAMPTKQRVCVVEEAVARLGGSVKAAAAGDTTPIMVHPDRAEVRPCSTQRPLAAGGSGQRARQRAPGGAQER